MQRTYHLPALLRFDEEVVGRAGPLLRQHRWRRSLRLGRARSRRPKNEIIAVVRYARKPGDERAEYAAHVEDRWQGHGVGASLTQRLIEEARGNEVRSFYALVKGANRRMLNVFRHLGLPEQERVEDGEKMVEIGLTS